MNDLDRLYETWSGPQTAISARSLGTFAVQVVGLLQEVVQLFS